MVEIRRVGAADWQLVRRVRLRALQDAPLYFWATYEEEASLPEASWRDRFMGPVAWFMAFDEHEAVGLAAAYDDRDLENGAWQLISMWVSPGGRGRGIGRALVEALIAWARESGINALYLEVTEGNEAAERLYESCGFRFTGRTQPHPRDPNLQEREMTLGL